MRHYRHLSEETLDTIFYKKPESFNKFSPQNILSKALGATLYTPATRETVADDIINKKYINLTSMVMDLEDALDDSRLHEGGDIVISHLKKIENAIENNLIDEDDIPLLFVRVRTPEHLGELLEKANDLKLLTGFCFPKFSTENAKQYLTILSETHSNTGIKFYAMPILESKEVIYLENRHVELIQLRQIINQYKDYVLNIRMGGTDFSGLYSIRRSIDTTIYDVVVVRDTISDILNFFNRAEDNFTVSGIVWEFFSNKKPSFNSRILKPALRETPFIKEKGTKEGLKERREILDDAIDGLIREILLDKANGIIGKTIIHPTHIPYVNAMQCVKQEEYEDAMMILENQGKGVLKSSSANKMNETRPHLSWANKIIEKSKVYGVLRYDKNFNSLF